MFTKPARAVSRVFCHCSASDNPAHDNIGVIRKWHLAQGWRDVGYHYFITSAGQIQPGRSLENTPAAQLNHNTGTIAICLHGLSKFTEAQFTALKMLCQEINQDYEGKITFHGHKEVDPSRACPVYDYKKILGLDEKGYMAYAKKGTGTSSGN